MTNPIDYLPFINLAGFLVNAYLFWKRGGTNATKEVMDLLEKQVEAQKDEILRLREKIHQLGNDMQNLVLELGTMKGVLTSKDQQIEEFTKIFQNRDPEMLTVLNEIKEFMKLLHDKVNANERRNVSIDRSTKADKGHVMRKEA